MTRELPDRLARVVADPRSYAEWNRLHEALTEIRREFPFARATLDGYNPFWVASKLADIREVALDNRAFQSGLASLETNETLRAKSGARKQFRSIVAMNEPDHSKFRRLTFDWFKPKSMERFEPRVRELARRFVAKFGEGRGECDFVESVAVHYPLLVMMSILGVPEQDEAFLLRLTRLFFGSRNDDAASFAEAEAEAVAEANAYFAELSADRRRHPRNDLVSVVANSRIDGEPIRDVDAMGYYITAAFAGHDTTSSSVAGGIWALAERPDQLEKVRSEPARVPALVEESVRWTSPVHQFVRIAADDREVAGQKVRKGDWVVLCFPSGNRDEEAFEGPFEFSVDRWPNRHIGFGHGAHVCLGIHLARMEMRILFEELLPRLKCLELAGTPLRTVTNFVGGPKALPIRYELS